MKISRSIKIKENHKYKVIACETVGEELRSLIPKEMPSKFFEFGLHNTPEKLHDVLQQEIDQTQEDVDTILLGYGMCSKGTLGLEARRFRLVIPKLDDCIGLFLGSRKAYRQQHQQAPGTFYLTRGWIECGDDPYTEYKKIKAKYGHEKAYQLEKMVIANYTRLLWINTIDDDMASYRAYARRVADFFELAFEEIQGSNALIKRLVEGDWNNEFVIVEPGGRVEYNMFAQ
ncbi:MAG: DUF1638 domain-containing protein [Anaerolineales bacterium]|nr:DUF1638 domain-containing protein [Anaerolineales bacterium]